MGLHHACLDLLVVALLVVLAAAIPTSLVDEIKSSELRNNKVKRAPSAIFGNPEENEEDVSYYKRPSAIKRAFALLVPMLDVSLERFYPKAAYPLGVNLDLKSMPDLEWEQEQADFDFINRNTLPNISSSLFKYPESSFGDDKTVAEYEKGFRYGANKDKLDEALENAILKSELYGEPASINQYRYFGADGAKKRKRRDTKKLRTDSRIKREVDLTPEEILALLSLYENGRPSQRQPPSENYRYPWNRFEANAYPEQDEPHQDQEENWLDTPVYPHASGYDREMGPKFSYEGATQGLDSKERWRGFEGDDNNRRIMVARKRNVDPTRELRYLNGPNKNDFYTLSHLLSNQNEPNLPVYHRLLL